MTLEELEKTILRQADEIDRLAEQYRQAVRALILAVGIVEAQHWLTVAASE
jgi:hypothetical protein